MTLLQMKYIVKVADFQSITLASRVLFTSPQNISKAIKSLEDELGERCFFREKEGIFLTDAGIKVYQIAKKIVELEDQLMNLFKENTSNEYNDTLHLYFSQGLSYLVHGFFEQLKAKNHSIKYYTYEHNASELVHLISKNCNCAFIETDKDSLLEIEHIKSNFEIYQLKEEPLRLVVSKNSPLIHQSSISLNTLKRFRFAALLNEGEEYCLNAKQIIEKNIE